MRTLNKNTTRMWYALHRASEDIYKLDEHGNKIVVYVDHSTIPPTTYYEKKGLHIKVNGYGTIDDIFSSIVNEIEKIK